MGVPKRQIRLTGRHALVDGIAYIMPVDSTDSSAIIAAFSIDWASAQSMMPPGDVHAYCLWNRGLLLVTVIDYRETDIGSYIEYSIAIACTNGANPAPRFLPAIFQKSFGTGQYVVDLPVSSEISVKGGKGIWGMPKHQASLDFKIGKAWVSAQYDMDGQMVSRFDVRRPSSAWLPLNTGAANYCTFRGMIMKSTIYFKGKVGVHLFKRGSARFVLGNHPRAAPIRALNMNPDPVFAAFIPQVNGLLDDYFECWFVTPQAEPQGPISEGLETTFPLGFGRDRLPPPKRDPAFDIDKA